MLVTVSEITAMPVTVSEITAMPVTHEYVYTIFAAVRPTMTE